MRVKVLVLALLLLCVQVASGQAVRRSIGSLDPNGPEIASLRHGIQIMMSRPSTDPTSWTFQANIHGTYDQAVTAQQILAWNQCQHGSFFFFSWHRMYLYYFERILRAASGNANLTLPYWNYTDPRQRTLPVAYRQPANSATNPLFVPNRAGPMNDGSGQLPAGDVDVSNAFGDLEFDTPHSAPADSFGGQTETQPIQFAAPDGDLETTPHNVVHVDVGGSSSGQCAGGWMTDPLCSARDPVFFLHHANIDRLWKRWLGLGGGRTDPTGDRTWMTTVFTFFDENGNQVQKTGKDIVDTVAQLDYCYDDDPGCQGPGFTWSLISNTTGFGNISADPTWIGDFSASGHSQVLFYSPGDDNWWLGSFNGAQLTWSLVGNTAGFGHRINDGRPFWVGRFSVTDREQILFYYPGDDNWWLGTVNGTQLTWSLVGNTAGFGHGINDGRPFWIGDFNGAGRAEVMFYYPGDDNWWLGSINGTQLTWSLVGNTAGFGHRINDGRPFWTGSFSRADRTQIMFYYPGDDNWWLGTVNGTQLTWSLVGNTVGFGHGINDGRPFWIGNFNGVGRDDVLFYYPGDDNWWLGTVNGTALTWSLVSNTAGFGHRINDGRPFWIGAFNGQGRSNVLFYYPGDGNWWLATDSSAGQFGWALVSSTREPTDIDFGDTSHDPTWIGDFTGAGHSQVLFYYPGDGNWWLGNYVPNR